MWRSLMLDSLPKQKAAEKLMQLKEKKRIIITNLAKIWENISKPCELEVVGVFNDPTCAAVFSRWRHVGSTFL